MRLSRRNDTVGGLSVQTIKDGPRLLFKWTPELRAAVDRGYALWPKKYPVPIDQPIILAKGRRAFTGDGLWQAFAAARDAAIEARNSPNRSPCTTYVRSLRAIQRAYRPRQSALGTRAPRRPSACIVASLKRSIRYVDGRDDIGRRGSGLLSAVLAPNPRWR